MTISMDRPTLSMYQFEKSWSSKIYQFGGTVVIQLVFGLFGSGTVALEPSWWWMVKNPLTCGGLEWNSMFNLFDVQGVMLPWWEIEMNKTDMVGQAGWMLVLLVLMTGKWGLLPAARFSSFCEFWNDFDKCKMWSFLASKSQKIFLLCVGG